jgi:hypothetical protein
MPGLVRPISSARHPAIERAQVSGAGIIVELDLPRFRGRLWI